MSSNQEKKGAARDQRPVTDDSRFKSVHNDPRFKRPSSRQFRVKVDDRFSRDELRKLNAGADGKHVKIDRYGRQLKGKDAAKTLDKFYEHESDNDQAEGVVHPSDEIDSESGTDSKASANASDSSDSESDESDSDSKALLETVSSAAKIIDRARGEGLASSGSDSNSDSDSNSGSDSDSDSDSFADLESESEVELDDTKPEEGDPTATLAVVNLDWDNITAIDLMATLSSFVPQNGLIKYVHILPSEFGKEQMQREQVEGPPRELFRSKKQRKADARSDSDSDSDSELDVNNKDDMERAARKLFSEEDGSQDYDSKALRRYQLQRLKYYYAIVKCDSVATCREIYEKCDGTEFESTANILDLRYVPDDMDFDFTEATMSCEKVPALYRPNTQFVTDALQHSKVKLTWDETPKDRLQLSSKQFSQREIDDMDFKSYLASDSDSEDDAATAAALKSKYQGLLGKKPTIGDQSDSDGEIDMEITFNPGLNDSQQLSVPSKPQEAPESTISAYKRKEKERRKRRLENMKSQRTAKDGVVNDIESKETADEKAKAELELVMMDESNEPEARHFAMKDIIKAEKSKGKKGKKGQPKGLDSEMIQDDFVADLADPRFKEVFENHEYAIDPNSAEFKRTKTMSKILDERHNRKRTTGETEESGERKQRQKKTKKAGQPAGKPASEISAIVDKLKRKNQVRN